MYHLGEIMNIQASFLMAEHAPFRLIMDSCVATLKSDSASVPRYVFVQNHGSVWILCAFLNAKNNSDKYVYRMMNAVCYGLLVF